MSNPFSMAGKKGVVLGVANKRSIGWGIAEALAGAGAQLGFSYQGDKIKDKITPLVGSLDGAFMLPLDVTDDAQVDAFFDGVKERWDGIDFVVHSIAFAKSDDLNQDFVRTSREGFALAHDISAYSLTRVCQAATPMMKPGGSVLTVSYLGGERVVQGYNVMGVAKAALEMSVRYLANDLGPSGIRVNAVSAGPVNTLAARGISGFTDILQHVAEKAPLRRNVTLDQIGGAGAFLLSDAAAGITGEVVHVDSGYHILGM